MRATRNSRFQCQQIDEQTNEVWNKDEKNPTLTRSQYEWNSGFISGDKKNLARQFITNEDLYNVQYCLPGTNE